MKRGRKELAAALALVALGLAGCGSAVKAPMAVEASGPPVQVYAAGSLREVFTAIASEHEARTGQKIVLTFGASGLLRERIEKGEPAQVFASADADHPRRLAEQGGWQPPVVFTRNALCALTSDKLAATPATLLATMLQPSVRVGISTPKADPAGDYAWALFGKADALQSGATARLQAKALKLTGGADSPKPPSGRGTYAWVMDQSQADVFLTYCTNAVSAQKEVPRLRIVEIPPELQVGAAYGVTVRIGAPQAADAFLRALLAPPAQAVFNRFGFRQP
ncbi:MAG TPA: molybdate ABC transporter substrate-binding protein [Burkholderiaceae bacterium]|nr:molybdate ABC transporter substrate-binding protein [Burkholderiaceae bacterium]